MLLLLLLLSRRPSVVFVMEGRVVAVAAVASASAFSIDAKHAVHGHGDTLRRLTRSWNE